jgi:hypothetical protein
MNRTKTVRFKRERAERKSKKDNDRMKCREAAKQLLDEVGAVSVEEKRVKDRG